MYLFVVQIDMVFKLFAILQKYDFSSKSQPLATTERGYTVVCDTAKVRFFKQITTNKANYLRLLELFAILQKYDFSSKSQPAKQIATAKYGCLRYCKSTIFQANHNCQRARCTDVHVVCDTAKVRFFKQITTGNYLRILQGMLFAILQKYDFSSKSQQNSDINMKRICCLRYCKSTIFQANHNNNEPLSYWSIVVCDTAKVRFFKQITTNIGAFVIILSLFAILQKYDFSSKSQQIARA